MTDTIQPIYNRDTLIRSGGDRAVGEGTTSGAGNVVAGVSQRGDRLKYDELAWDLPRV